MCKFYRIASNSLQAIQIVNGLFDCPSYVSGLLLCSYFGFDACSWSDTIIFTTVSVLGVEERHYKQAKLVFTSVNGMEHD